MRERVKEREKEREKEKESVSATEREWKRAREDETVKERASGGASDRRREFASRNNFWWIGSKPPWKLHQKRTKGRARTKKVPLNTNKRPV